MMSLTRTPTRMLHRLLFVLLFMGFAAQGAAQTTAPSEGVELPALSELNDGWNVLHPGGETTCAHGDDFLFYACGADPTRLMVYLHTGGGCSDAETCDPERDTYTYASTVEPKRDPAGMSGILDLEHPENPVAGYSMVAVPVCTGDGRLGDRDVTYTLETESGETRQFTIHHRGLTNTMAAIDWIRSNFESPREIFVAGKSADALLEGAEKAADPARAAVETAIRAYLDAFAAQDPELVRGLVTDDFVVIENGYPIPLGRATEGMDPRRPIPMEYRLDDLQIEIGGDLAVYRFDLGWFADGEQVDWGLETGHARRIGGEWKLAQNHMTFLPARGDLPVAATLGAYEGDYRGLDFQGREDLIRLYLDDGRLFMTRPDGRPLIGGILRLETLPDPAGDFFVEVLNGRVEFETGPTGEVSGLTYIPTPEQHPDYRSPLRYEKVR